MKRSKSLPLPKSRPGRKRAALWQSAYPRTRRKPIGAVLLGVAILALVLYVITPAAVAAAPPPPIVQDLVDTAKRKVPGKVLEKIPEKVLEKVPDKNLEKLPIEKPARAENPAKLPKFQEIEDQDVAEKAKDKFESPQERREDFAEQSGETADQEDLSTGRFDSDRELDDISSSLLHTESESLPKSASLAVIFRFMMRTLPEGFQRDLLLAPIETSGVERMRIVGIRVREYAKLLKIWDALHMAITTKGATFEDDISHKLMTHKNLANELGISPRHLVRNYESFRHVVTMLGHRLFPWTAPYFPSHSAMRARMHQGGRGICLSAGNDQMPFLRTQIRHLRSLGMKLPIEVLYLGDDDLREQYREEIEELDGVTTRNIRHMIDDDGWQIKGWAGKPWAMLVSTFREAMFIDADSLFLQNPEVLFDHPDYKRTGALFFKDRLMMAESKRTWLREFIPTPYSQQVLTSRPWTGESAHMQESGVVLIDKFKHFLSLMVVCRMNGPDRDGNSDKGIKGVYEMVYGDKETFWLSFESTGDTDYAFHPGHAGIMGTLNETRQVGDETKYTICAPQLLHLDDAGKPLWLNGGLLRNKFEDPTVNNIAEFELYMAESAFVPHAKEQWQLQDSNICCLTGDTTHEFTPHEQKTLAKMIEIARKVGAIRDEE